MDYYAVLGVAPDSEDVVIQAAYRALMRRYHPDVNSSKDAASRAQDINRAYAVLNDPARRKTFDRSRTKSADADNGRDQKTRSSPPPPPPPSEEPEQDVKKGGNGDESISVTSWRSTLITFGLIAMLLLVVVWQDATKPHNNETTMNVDTNMTTETVTMNDTSAVDDSLANLTDSAGNIADNVTEGLILNEQASIPTLATQPMPSIRYADIETAAWQFATILRRTGISGARAYSERCHRNVNAKPTWPGADSCAAFDIAAVMLDEAYSSKAGIPENGYFQFQKENQSDNYVSAGASAYSIGNRLTAIRQAVGPPMLEAITQVDASTKKVRQPKATGQTGTSDSAPPSVDTKLPNSD